MGWTTGARSKAPGNRANKPAVELSFNPYLAFAWSVLAGFIMAMGGGGGGILAGIGHISVLGIGDPNMIKAVNQILEFVSRIFSVPIYHRQKRIVWPLAISFGIGAPFGAVAGSWFSKHYLSDMASYRPVFGILVALVAARVLYEAWSKSAGRNERAKKAYDASEKARLAHNSKDKIAGTGEPPRTLSIAVNKIRILFGGHEFDFNPLVVAAGAFGVSFLGAMVGVGGGFLVTPFMATVLLFPMYLVVGTGLVALMVPLLASVAAYVAMQVHLDLWLVGIEAAGIMVGSIAGPLLNRYVNERLLKLYVAVVLFAIGIFYLLP